MWWSKSPGIEGSNTYWAQGGIVSFGQDDKPELLKEDILKAGDYIINNPEAVEVLVAEGRRSHRPDFDPGIKNHTRSTTLINSTMPWKEAIPGGGFFMWLMLLDGQ